MRERRQTPGPNRQTSGTSSCLREVIKREATTSIDCPIRTATKRFEHVDDLVLPQGISDVWFRGRARRDLDKPLGTTELWLARFQAGSGWHRYVVRIEEQQLRVAQSGYRRRSGSRRLATSERSNRPPGRQLRSVRPRWL